MARNKRTWWLGRFLYYWLQYKTLSLLLPAERINLVSKLDETIIINDERFEGKPTYANISAAIETALKKTKRKSSHKQVA